MNRTEYLTDTRLRFSSTAIPSLFFPDHFYPIKGVFRVLEIIADDDQSHPQFTEVPFILKCRCIWKENMKEDFLQEIEYWLDLTELLEFMEIPQNLPGNLPLDYEKKLHYFYAGSIWRDIHITEIENLKWTWVYKNEPVIVSEELNDNHTIVAGERLLPLPEKSTSNSKIYSFSGNDEDYSSPLYPTDAKVIHITENNFEEILKYEIGPTLYFMELNIFRNKYAVQIAETVPVKGYYKIYGLRLDPPRKITKNIGGKIIKEPAPWDLPYQIIGIGHWLNSEVPANKPLKFNEEISIEVRLNPLFNQISSVEGLDSDFPKEKRWDTFYSIATQRVIWIKEIRLENNAYFVDWELVNHTTSIKV